MKKFYHLEILLVEIFSYPLMLKAKPNHENINESQGHTTYAIVFMSQSTSQNKFLVCLI